MTAATPEAREAMRAQIVETLGEHAYMTFGYCLGCDWLAFDDGSDEPDPYPDQHRAHLADVLLGLWDGGES